LRFANCAANRRLLPLDALSEIKPSLIHCSGRAELVMEAHRRLALRREVGNVFVEGERRDVTAREFELLQFLVQHPTRAYGRKELLNCVWGRRAIVRPRTIDVHIRRLRQKIERDDSRPEVILNVRKVGYRFNESALG
jgi:DNA-binding response OmpR family regulator